MIATYIQELLATNNRVIVPNYGAFLVRATSKSKDATTLAEKLKDVYFSPFLKFNDELLEKYIITKEGISKEQAAEKITAFINDVKKELEEEKPYKIEGFGEFVADKQGKVQFITSAKEVVEKPAPKTPKKDEKKEADKPIKESSAKTEKKAAVKKTPEKKEEPKKETIITKEESKPLNAEIKKEEPKKESKPESKLEEFKPETKASSESTKTKSIYSNKKEKKSVNKGLVWAIALGLPIAAIFIWGLLNFSTIKKVFIKDKAKTEKTDIKKTTLKTPVTKTTKETAKTESQEKKEETTAKVETKQAEVKPEVKPPPPQKKYYIIAGSFKNEKYAFSYMNKLKAEGYNAEKLDERNGMHAVSFNSFTDKKKAIAEYKYLSNEKGLQAWILYH